MCQSINTHSTSHSGLFAIYSNRKLVTSRQGQAQGQDHNRGSEDTADLFVRRCTDSGMREGRTLPSTNAGALSPAMPAGTEVLALQQEGHRTQLRMRASACFSGLFPRTMFLLTFNKLHKPNVLRENTDEHKTQTTLNYTPRLTTMSMFPIYPSLQGLSRQSPSLSLLIKLDFTIIY